MAKVSRKNKRASRKAEAARPLAGRIRTSHVAKREKGFPIVCVGSSAGGLEALESFFKHVPSNMGIAFVIVSHLDPHHRSILAELLSRYTTMDVVEARDRIKVRPDCVYVIPSGKDMIIADHTLRVYRRRATLQEPHMPIDNFLRSLAETQDMNAIAVILSGNGTDGSFGLRFIKGNLGMAMVQTPETAKYDSMPKNAIASGLVDYVLPPSEMPEQIIKYVNTLKARGEQTRERAPLEADSVARILALVKQETGHDFSLYKKSTILRRIERRMSVHQIQHKGAYSEYLKKNPNEVRMLFKELLIQVTRFFRDPEAFDALKEVLRKNVFGRRPSNSELRVWVPGCSSGEEVYSIAIILNELMEETDRRFNVQIFGTDIDEEAIANARAGTYPASIATDVSPKRIDKNFLKEDDRLKVRKEIREMAIFAPQNAVRDPPFLRMDMISCRNLLIYFEPVLQRKLLDTMTFALNPSGILFLGSSESVDGYADNYSTVNSKWKLYQRMPAKEGPGLTPDVSIARVTVPRETVTKAKLIPERLPSINVVSDKMMLTAFSPPSIVLNDKDEIVYFHGRTGKYLEPSPGRASLTLQSMIKEDVRYAVMSAVREVRRSSKRSVKKAARVHTNGDANFLNIIATPVEDLSAIGGVMIVFQEVVIPQEVLKQHKTLSIAPDKDAYIAELEKELSYTKESLQSTIEELETSNEELKSTNEELQSTNEELQSVAEESETAKEETHSLNEELMSVNAELEKRNEELTATASDMRNLMNSIDVAVVFLDSKLRIKRFTEQVSKIANLLPSDLGRSIQDISIKIDYANLAKDVQEVLEKLNSRERDVKTRDGRWFHVKILPYRTVDNVIDGVVLTFIDIEPEKGGRAAKA